MTKGENKNSKHEKQRELKEGGYLDKKQDFHKGPSSASGSGGRRRCLVKVGGGGGRKTGAQRLCKRFPER